MPNAEMFTRLVPPLMFAGTMLLFMDMAFNVTMQPFRALVADMVGDSQRTKGYAVQTFLINAGAIVGSVLPFVLVNWFGFSGQGTANNAVPAAVAWSYYIGGAILLLTVLVTSLRTREYPPEQYNKYNNDTHTAPVKVKFRDLVTGIPRTMWQLSIVQFFSWFSLFLLWTYTTPAVAASVWHTSDTSSVAYNQAGDWVGVLFAVYSLFSALFALVIVAFSSKIGNKGVYAFSLVLGGVSFVAMSVIDNQYMLFVPMLGIGIAWAAILAMPYAILSKAIPSDRMGVYMGVFNFTITIPQIVCGILGGVLVKNLFGGDASAMIVLAGVSLIMGAVSVAMIREKKTI